MSARRSTFSIRRILLLRESHNARMIGQLCQRDSTRRAGGRALIRTLPEILHFRDSGEIMYEVPMFLHSLSTRSLSISTSHSSSDFSSPEISFHDIQFGRPMKRLNRIGRANGANNNRMKTNHRCQITGRSLQNLLFLSLSLANPSLTSFIDR